MEGSQFALGKYATIVFAFARGDTIWSIDTPKKLRSTKELMNEKHVFQILLFFFLLYSTATHRYRFI